MSWLSPGPAIAAGTVSEADVIEFITIDNAAGLERWVLSQRNASPTASAAETPDMAACGSASDRGASASAATSPVAGLLVTGSQGGKETLLHTAARFGAVQCVHSLLRLGGDVNATASHGHSVRVCSCPCCPRPNSRPLAGVGGCHSTTAARAATSAWAIAPSYSYTPCAFLPPLLSLLPRDPCGHAVTHRRQSRKSRAPVRTRDLCTTRLSLRPLDAAV